LFASPRAEINGWDLTRARQNASFSVTRVHNFW
jgi:hypothetical protein